MFNLWKRAYVHTMEQSTIFDSKTIIADEQYSTVVFPESMFSAGNSVIHAGNSISDVVTAFYDGKVSNLFAAIAADDSKWSIVVSSSDYYYLLGCYLKELQAAYQLTIADLALVAFSYPYDNFYYSDDPAFLEGFLEGNFQQIMKTTMDSYEPSGLISDMNPGDLPTEVAYFLLRRGKVTQEQLIPKFVNAAQLITTRLQDTRSNDLSEWCVENTRQFLNILRVQERQEVITDNFTFQEFAAYVHGDPNLTSMLLNYIPLSSPGVDWSSVAAKTAAADIVEVWERMFVFEKVSILRGTEDGSTDTEINMTWLRDQAAAYVDDVKYLSLLTECLRIQGVCAAIKYLLGLRGAPSELESPLIDLLGYDSLSEAMTEKYNKTLLLIGVNAPSATFVKFADSFFGEVE